MPLGVIDRIVVDPARGAECLSAIRAAHEHHVAPVEPHDAPFDVRLRRLHARQHVNTVASNGARAVHRQKNLPHQSGWIYEIAGIDVAAEIDRRALIKTWRDASVLGVTRANAPKLGRVIWIYPANK